MAIQTNQYGQNYIGNDDYRGWLYALSKGGDSVAGGLLNVAGNDGGVSNPGMYMDDGVSAYRPASDINGEYYSTWNKQRTGANANRYAATSNNTGNGSVTTTATTTAASTTSAKDAEEEAKKQAMIDYYKNIISNDKAELGGMDSTLKGLNDSAKNQYDTSLNEMLTSYNKNKGQYEDQSVQNQQDRLSSRNNIMNNASSGLRGLLRILGANGAGGSSAAMYSAPQIVTDQANSELAGVSEDYAKNQREIDTNWNNYVYDYDNDKKKLLDYYNSQLRQNEQKVLEQKNSALKDMLSAYANLGFYGGGENTAKMNDITKQINDNKARYNKLNEFVKPTYDGITAQYKAPSLSSYNNRDVELTTDATANQAEAAVPTLAMLLGVTKKDKE